MQDKQDRKKSNKPKKSKPAAFETFPLVGADKDSRGITIPTEEGVIAAKKFVEENKK